MLASITRDPRTKRPNSFSENTIKRMIKPQARISFPFTGNTPEVMLDKNLGTAFILGRCLCSNPHDFFKPLIQWANEYEQDPQQVTVVTINTDYINTGSSMALRHFLGILAKVQFTGRKIIIKWYCDKTDDNTRHMINMIEEIIKVKIQVEVGE